MPALWAKLIARAPRLEGNPIVDACASEGDDHLACCVWFAILRGLVRGPAYVSGHVAAPVCPAVSNSRCRAAIGTNNRPPIRRTGISPRAAAAYAAFRQSPKTTPASGTEIVAVAFRASRAIFACVFAIPVCPNECRLRLESWRLIPYDTIA